MGTLLSKIYGYVTVIVKKGKETVYRIESNIYRGRGWKRNTMPPATVIGHTYNYYGLKLHAHAVLLQPIQFKIIPTQHILTTRRKLMEKKADGRE
jgi:hypothetical protein